MENFLYSPIDEGQPELQVLSYFSGYFSMGGLITTDNESALEKISREREREKTFTGIIKSYHHFVYV